MGMPYHSFATEAKLMCKKMYPAHDPKQLCCVLFKKTQVLAEDLGVRCDMVATWLVIRWYGREESKRGQLFSCWSEKNHDDPASQCTATTNDTENVMRKNHTGHTHDDVMISASNVWVIT